MDTYIVIFNLNKYDLDFAFSYRKTCKLFKNISEYWMTCLQDINYINNVALISFKNLVKIYCNSVDDVQGLCRIKSLHVKKEPVDFLSINISVNSFKCDDMKFSCSCSSLKLNSKMYNNFYEFSTIKDNCDIVNDLVNFTYPFKLTIIMRLKNKMKIINHMFLNTLHTGYGYTDEQIDFLKDIKHMDLYDYNFNMYEQFIHIRYYYECIIIKQHPYIVVTILKHNKYKKTVILHMNQIVESVKYNKKIYADEL